MSEPTNDELIAKLASAPDLLDSVAPTLAARQSTPGDSGGAARATGEDGWTTSEIIGHLCDGARYWGARMRLAVYEENPRLEPYDQEAFVRLAAYRYTPVETLTRQFRLINQSNVAFLRELTPEQWRRSGVHGERGPLSVRALVEIEAEHELEHVRSLGSH